jgi:vesicular inhibitory amino acid transporter
LPENLQSEIVFDISTLARSLHTTSEHAVMGVISTCVVLLMVVWMGAMDGIGFTHSGPLVRWNEFPLAIGVYGFCYSGHAVFPNIYASMKNKDKYLLVLVVR